MPKTFQLPPGWFRDTIAELVDTTLPPLLGPLDKGSAWRYLTAIAAWAEEHGGRRLPHLNDVMKTKNGQELAARGLAFLDENLLAVPGNAVDHLDYIGQARNAERTRQGFGPAAKQRDQNTTGAAFEAGLQVVIERLCGVLPARTPDLRTLQGFELAPTGYHSEPDLALFSARDFRLLISTKWTLRKERIGTYLHEAYFYKQRRPDLQVAFVVAEFSSSILTHLSRDPLVDRVYHLHLPWFLKVHEPFRDVAEGGSVDKARLMAVPPRERSELAQYGRWLSLSERVFDLSQLFDDIDTLKLKSAAADPADEPEGDEPEGEEGSDELF